MTVYFEMFQNFRIWKLCFCNSIRVKLLDFYTFFKSKQLIPLFATQKKFRSFSQPIVFVVVVFKFEMKIF